jgi:hypothetical protein
MCLRAVVVGCAVVLCGFVPCFAQQASGPRTLETLLKDDAAVSAQRPVAIDATAPAAATPLPSGRIQGAVARPKDGVQYPDLDKAWADYDAAVAKATESIKAAIAKQFDAATAKGDLDAAEKWQAALEKFEKAGEVPSGGETKAAVIAAVNNCKKAKETLVKSYEAVVKALTMDKKLGEAKAVRAEGSLLEKSTPDVAARGLPNEGEAPVRQKALAAFIGSWINDGNRDHQLIRADGKYIVNGNPSHEWSGRWALDMEDHKGPCLIRVAHNGQTTRFYVHPQNPQILMYSHGLMRRE